MEAESPIYGPVPGNRLPKQDTEKVMLLANKFSLARAAQEPWAIRAKESIAFIESDQYTEDEKEALVGRPSPVFNKIAPLYRLVLGYQANNRTDIRYLPGHDGSGTEEVAEILTQAAKQISDINQLPFEDQTVFSDGISTGRGYWRSTLDFTENDFGEIRIRAVDPFSVYPDPDAESYDLNETANFIQTTRWVSIDEIEWALGKKVADEVRPYTGGQGWNGFSSLQHGDTSTTAPPTSFAERDDDEDVEAFRGLFHESFVDASRKTLRVLETEYKVTQMRDVFIDMETGDSETIPEHWTELQIMKALYHAKQLGNPLTVRKRPVKRIRWVIMVGDIIAYDDWSPYETFTHTPYFPYFRRGTTRGMIDDLKDPQREYNKRRMTRLEIMSKIANGGWMLEDGTMDPMQERNLLEYGSTSGVVIKHKPGTSAPSPIQAQNIPAEHAQLEEAANQDIREIAGINESALGQIDRVQSGRAIEARQRQAVIGLQMYIDNYKRSKQLQGRKMLNLVQRHYTEERMFRVIGEDGSMVQSIINSPEKDEYGNIVGKLNDVTLGKYAVIVDESPMSASFLSGQFEEAMSLWEKLAPFAGPALPALADTLIDMSSLPRKDEIKERLANALGTTAINSGTVPIPPQGPVPVEQAQIPQQPGVAA